SQRDRATFTLCWPATLSIVCAVGLLGLVDLGTSPSHTSDNLPPGPLFVAPASLHHRWDALDDDWVQRLARRRAWVAPVRAALLLKIGDLIVEHLHLARLAGTQLVADIEPIDHDVILALAGVLHDHSRRRCVKSLLAWLGAHRRVVGVVVGHLQLLFFSRRHGPYDRPA